MSKVTFVTYGGDSCFFEAIDKQPAHTKRITDWLNSGRELSVLAFSLDGESGLDMLVAIGECCHRDLHDSLVDRDMTFKVEGKKYSVGGDIGGFCVRKNGTNVVYTRDSGDFGRVRSVVGNIHRQAILLRLDRMLKMANLNGNRKARKATAPQCKKPILSFADQLKKLKAWEKAYAGWKYKNKGGFPEIPENILELAEAAPKLDGFRPAVEINFYLETFKEHRAFMFEVVWKIETGKAEWIDGSKPDPVLINSTWPGKTVKVVGLDIEAYSPDEGVSAYDIGIREENPIHVELFTHIVMHGLEYPSSTCLDIPGIQIPDKTFTVGYRMTMNGCGLVDVGIRNPMGFIPLRMF